MVFGVGVPCLLAGMMSSASAQTWPQSAGEGHRIDNRLNPKFNIPQRDQSALTSMPVVTAGGAAGRRGINNRGGLAESIGALRPPSFGAPPGGRGGSAQAWTAPVRVLHAGDRLGAQLATRQGGGQNRPSPEAVTINPGATFEMDMRDLLELRRTGF